MVEQVTAIITKYKVGNNFVTSNTEIIWHCAVKMTFCIFYLCIFVWSEMSADWCEQWGWRSPQQHPGNGPVPWDAASLHLTSLPHLDRMLLWSLHHQWPQSLRASRERPKDTDALDTSPPQATCEMGFKPAKWNPSDIQWWEGGQEDLIDSVKSGRQIQQNEDWWFGIGFCNLQGFSDWE